MFEDFFQKAAFAKASSTRKQFKDERVGEAVFRADPFRRRVQEPAAN
jgi:hypothetical protein